MSDQQTPPEETPPVEETTLTGPWAQDVRTAFEDPQVQAAVDAFLREKIQPHVTRVEQQASISKQAQELYDDLQADPGQTYLAITEELFGTPAVDKIVAALQAGDVETAATELQAAEGKPEGGEVALNEDDRKLLERLQRETLERDYNRDLDSFIADGHTDVVKDIFHPFVANADGRFDVAYAQYQEWKGHVPQEWYTPPEAAAETAPPTIGGGESAGTTTPPIQKVYTSLDEAMDDFWDEIHPSAPPTVGSV